ncbi:MAG: extracellular solute-binding protein [Lachnospiraceae bacterium]|nr:extracellular solute-binding protein [Lachnospiraceae bacterium]
MKTKRLLAVGLAAGMVMSLAACGNKAQESSQDQVQDQAQNDAAGDEAESQASAEDKGGKTIVFSTNVVGEKADALEAACRAFEEETGNIVDFQAPGSDYEELMKTKMASNQLPDVFTTHGWSVARYSDYLMPINDMEWAKDIDGQIKSVITNADGDMFVLPVDIDIAGIVCNMDVLEEAGVDPDAVKTWDDFGAACDKIVAAGKNPIHMGGKDSWPIGQFFDWAAPSFYITDENSSKAEELKGGTFDTSVWESVAGLLDGWVKAGYLNEDCLTADYNSDIESLASGNTAFCFYGNSSVVDAKGVNPDANLGMIPIPSASADDEASLIAGEDIAVGIWKDTEVKDEAIELLNYLARPDVMKAIAEAAGSKAGLTTATAEIGDIGEYLTKYASVETYPYFDREYLPSGMWDVMCTTGADILSQKDGAIESAAKVMEQNFNDKYTP